MAQYKGIVRSELEVSELIRISGRDPLLLNLSLHVSISNGDFTNAGDQVIKTFIYDKIRNVYGDSPIPDIKNQLLLQKLGLALLIHKNINPTYNELISWNNYDSQVLNFIDIISGSKELFFLTMMAQCSTGTTG